MKEILVLSGKGGTGKTTFTSSFVSLAGDCIVCDYDVDASNLPLLLHPVPIITSTFSGGEQALIDRNTCIECGLCQESCRFQAIKELRVQPLECEGCAFCAHLCPVEAITMQPRPTGKWYSGTADTGQTMFYAELQPGEDNSGKLVAQVKQAAWEEAKFQKVDLIISDGPPGIGCPVISSLVNVDLVVIITEPSRSGFHDAGRIKELLDARGVKAVMVVNKCDLDAETSSQLQKWAEAHDLPIVGTVPFDKAIADAIISGRIPVAQATGRNLLLPIWQNICHYLDSR